MLSKVKHKQLIKIDHEQIVVDDAKNPCVKKGVVEARHYCTSTLDVEIDGKVYKDVELCYHCQQEKKFTPEKAMDIFDVGTKVLVLIEDPSNITSKTIKVFGFAFDEMKKIPGNVPCYLKRFFAKVQKVGDDGYPTHVCEYYWIHFNPDGSVLAMKVNHKSEVDLLNRAIEIPGGSASVFTKSFLMYNNTLHCYQRYVAEQHMLLRDKKVLYEYANYPQNNCMALKGFPDPAMRFYCNVKTGDMVWFTAGIEPCNMLHGVVLHVDLETGEVGDSYPFDFWGYTNYFNPSEPRGGHGYWTVDDNVGASDAPYDLIPDIVGLNGTKIFANIVIGKAPVYATFDVKTFESHWSGADNIDAYHMIWTEKGFENVFSWGLKQKINPASTGDHSDYWEDDGEYGPINDVNTDTRWMSELCHSFSAGDCLTKCAHCKSVHRDWTRSWTQDTNGESHVHFAALGTTGVISDYWNKLYDKEGRSVKYMACGLLGETGGHWCAYGGTNSYFYWLVSSRQGSKDYKTKISNSVNVKWLNQNITYVKSRIERSYHNRHLYWLAGGCPEDVEVCEPWQSHYGQCGGPSIQDYGRWTGLCSDCLLCVAGVPDFQGPLVDFPNWPPWPSDYTESSIWQAGSAGTGWYYHRDVNKNDFSIGAIEEFCAEDGISFDSEVYKMPYYLDDRTSEPSAGLIIAAKGDQDGSSHWKIYHKAGYVEDVTDKILEALGCNEAGLLTIGMV